MCSQRWAKKFVEILFFNSCREFGMHLKEMGAHFSTNEKVMVSYN